MTSQKPRLSHPPRVPTHHEDPTSSGQRTPPPSACNSTPPGGSGGANLSRTCCSLEPQGPAGGGQRGAGRPGLEQTPLCSPAASTGGQGPLTRRDQLNRGHARPSRASQTAARACGRAGLRPSAYGPIRQGDGTRRAGRQVGTVTPTLEPQDLAQAVQRQKELCLGEYYSKSRRSDKTILLLLKKETKN